MNPKIDTGVADVGNSYNRAGSPLTPETAVFEKVPLFWQVARPVLQGKVANPAPLFMGSWLTHLFAGATTLGMPLQVAGNGLQSVEPSGLAWLTTPKTSWRARPTWWPALTTQLPADQRPQAEAGVPLLYLHWPTFLRNALDSMSSPLQHHVIRLLCEFAELIEQHDWALGHLLREWRHTYHLVNGNPARSPRFYGQRTYSIHRDPTKKDFEVNLFTAHMGALLKNPDFLREWTKALDQSMDNVAAPQNLQSLRGRCFQHQNDTLNSHRCIDCAQRDWQRHESILFDPKLMRDYTIARRCSKRGIEIREPLTTNQWVNEARFLLAGVNEVDGVLHCVGPQRQRWILVRYDWFLGAARMAFHRHTNLGQYTLGTSSPEEAGTRVAKAFRLELPDYVFADRKRSIDDVAYEASQGTWSIPATLDHQFDLLSRQGLIDYVKRSTDSKKNYKGIKGVGTGDTHHRKVITLPWEYEGKHHDVQVILRACAPDSQSRTWAPYFRIPWIEITSDRLAYERTSAKGRASVVGGHTFWSLKGLSFLVNLREGRYNPLTQTLPGRKRRRNTKDVHPSEFDPGSDELEFPPMREFIDWAIEQGSALTPSIFRKHYYDATQHLRRAEIDSGKRSNIGRFTTVEDNVIRALFDGRPPGNVMTAEWSALHTAVPDRSIPALRSRVAILAFQYAKEHGWAKFLESGWWNDSWRKDVIKREYIKKGVGP